MDTSDQQDAAIGQKQALQGESTSGNAICRSWFQEEIDRVKGYWQTESYAKAMRKRQVWVEPMFAEAKEWHGWRQFRLRRLHKVNTEALLTAAGQNLKRLLKAHKRRYRPHDEGMASRCSPLFELLVASSWAGRYREIFSTRCYLSRHEEDQSERGNQDQCLLRS